MIINGYIFKEDFNMKRIFSLVLVMVIILGSVIPVFANSPETEDLARFGVISGNGEDYNEGGVLTRAEFTVILSQLYGLKDMAEGYIFDASYTDLVKGEWYYSYVAFSEAKGWMSGMGDGTFAPKSPMTAQQVNSMYVKALGYNVSWDDVNDKAEELGIAVVASDPNKVLRGEAFKALRKSLDVVQNGSTYTLGTNLELIGYKSTNPDAPVVVIPPEDLGIVSVKALNLKQVEVVYNMTINDSGDESNYSIETDGTAVLNSSSDFKLQEDGKTVIITLTHEANQQEKLEFEIRNMFDLNKTVVLEFIDLKVPSVLDAQGISMNTIRVNFSEPMDTGLTTKSNYSVETSKGSRIYVKEITTGKNNMSVLLELYSDLKGNEVITIEDIKDYQGYKIVSVDEVVTLDIDSDPPVVTSYKNADQNSVTLVFDSDIEFSDASLSNYYCSNTSNIATDISITDNEMTLEFSDVLPAGITYVYIEKSSIEDRWGNENDKISKKIEIVIDRSAPKVVGVAEVTSQASVEINFDQDVIETGDDFELTLRDDKGDILDYKIYVNVENDQMELIFDRNIYGVFTVELKGVEDKNGNVSRDMHLEFVVKDETNPKVSDFVATIYDGSLQLIRVDFKEEMNTQMITDKSLYFYGNESLDDEVVKIKLVNDNKSVELEVPSDYINMYSGRDLTIGRVADASGNYMNAIYGELELLDGDDIKIEIKSVELINDKTVVLTVLDDKLAGVNIKKFSFNSDVTIDRIVPSINDMDESIITFILDDSVDSNDRLLLTVTSNAGENVYGQFLESGSFTVKDLAAPVVEKVDFVNSETIRITFNEPLNANAFSRDGHNGFSVLGGQAELTSVAYSASQLTIKGTGFTEDTNVYYNSLFGITDVDGNLLESFSKTSKLQ